MGKNKNNAVAADTAQEKTTAVENNAVAEKESNIEEQIKQKNSLNADYFDKAAEEINKKREQIAVDEAKECIGRAEYTNTMALLELRHNRKKEAITKEFLNETKQLLDETKAGKYTKIEHNGKYREIFNKRQKALDEAQAVYNTAVQEVKRNFADWDIWTWNRNWGI